MAKGARKKVRVLGQPGRCHLWQLVAAHRSRSVSLDLGSNYEAAITNGRLVSAFVYVMADSHAVPPDGTAVTLHTAPGTGTGLAAGSMGLAAAQEIAQRR